MTNSLATITERIVSDFMNLGLEEYGKWRVDRNLAKSFLVASLAEAWKEGYEAGQESQEQALWEATSKLQ